VLQLSPGCVGTSTRPRAGSLVNYVVSSVQFVASASSRRFNKTSWFTSETLNTRSCATTASTCAVKLRHVHPVERTFCRGFVYFVRLGSRHRQHETHGHRSRSARRWYGQSDHMRMHARYPSPSQGRRPCVVEDTIHCDGVRLSFFRVAGKASIVGVGKTRASGCEALIVAGRRAGARSDLDVLFVTCKTGPHRAFWLVLASHTLSRGTRHCPLNHKCRISGKLVTKLVSQPRAGMVRGRCDALPQLVSDGVLARTRA